MNFDPDKPHTLADDFAHFLAYQNWSQLPAEEVERLRIAYEHGSERGSALIGGTPPAPRA